MAPPPSSPSSPCSSSIDDDLCHLATTSLNISQTKTITKCNETGFLLPKACHAGLYNYKYSSGNSNAVHCDLASLCAEVAQGLELSSSSKSKHPFSSGCDREDTVGVPGFPNFPFFWNGHEGGGKSARRRQQQRQQRLRHKKSMTAKAKITKSKVGDSMFSISGKKQHPRMMRKMHRQAVNSQMIMAANNKRGGNHKSIPQETEQACRSNCQDELVEINRSLASLKW